MAGTPRNPHDAAPIAVPGTSSPHGDARMSHSPGRSPFQPGPGALPGMSQLAGSTGSPSMARPAMPGMTGHAEATAKRGGRGGGRGGRGGRGAAGRGSPAASTLTVNPDGSVKRKTLREAYQEAQAAAAMQEAAAAAAERAAREAQAAAVRPPPPTHFNRLDESDLSEARALGLLSDSIQVTLDAASSEYGIAYEKRGGSKVTGCGTDVFPSQRALQERCKQFAMERGFQLFVAGSSSRPDGGGNVKYRCKKLHGQQFFDPHTPADQIQCPFYINGYGLGPAWKITRACFLHNHYKFIGSRLAAAGEGGNGANGVDESMEGQGAGADGANVATKNKAVRQRNTTLSTNVLCRMVNEELDRYPSSAIAMSKLDGKLIKRILLSRGHTVNHMMASRIKRQIQMTRITSIRSSFQKLQSYLELIAEKNPGTQFHFEVDERSTFKRAMVMPNTTMHAMRQCQKVIALDRIRPQLWRDNDGSKVVTEDMDDESDDAVSGVYLFASTKDHNDQVLVFAMALVSVENQENWSWFLSAIQNAQAFAYGNGPNWSEYTVFAARTHGLLQAVQNVMPQASHHLCVRRLVEEELVTSKKIPLPEDKKQRIYDLARSDSEAEYKHIRQELALTNEAAVQFLDGLSRTNWVKFAFMEVFKKPTYGVVSSDLLALDDTLLNTSTNGVVAPMKSSDGTPSTLAFLKQWFGDDVVRSSQPLLAFNRYFMKIAENFHARRKLVEHRPPHELVSKRFTQLEQILQGSQRCESVPCSNGTYMVRSLAQIHPTGHDTWRHVNLLDWECTCLEWQDRLFPCVHGIHAAELNRRRIDSLYDIKAYSAEHYKQCYEMGFTPWPLDAAALEVDGNLKIPLDDLYAVDPNAKRKPGPRPKLHKLLRQANQATQANQNTATATVNVSSGQAVI
ncbi:hypothetical protein Poli38472_005456 [Pythium oligandrum]|uniref:SWIM-type domain-containing protein n=1 Tax=Pythium oligandrum TaxID=41045 RepID=A0A8K1CH05_PYTOL|nr:hypothetical protein Poli38472_005456 [Pythium oligandrum]|eukprot:TMW62838.1 hypothetical protein Poli38472_005456 [Pythium oligandrum]